MTFQVKPEDERRDAVVAIPMTRAMRRRVEAVAKREGISLSEFGRRAVGRFLEDRKRARESTK